MLKLTAKRTKWFPVTKDESGESQIEIIYLKPGEVAEIEEGANSIVQKQQGDEFQTEVNLRLNQRTKSYVTAAVVDWKGFSSIKGVPLKCTEFNKLEVLKEFDWFGDFVDECRTTLSEEVTDESEEIEGN